MATVATDTEDYARRRGKGIYLLPNLLTTGCLFSGFYAVVAAIDKNFDHAGIAVFFAMIFDTLDGRVARLTRTESAFGKEYDSLADMVSFGVAPAIVAAAAIVAAFVWFFSEWHEPRLVGLVAAFAVTASAGALMVSRFGYPSFKQFDLDRRIKFVYMLLVPLFFVLIAIDPPTMLLSIFGVYALSAPLLWVMRRLRRLARGAPGGAQ
jgi:CDP-diacylglycerol--serine O-phosphatidyltransferase